jgi:hypothetical protein
MNPACQLVNTAGAALSRKGMSLGEAKQRSYFYCLMPMCRYTLPGDICCATVWFEIIGRKRRCGCHSDCSGDLRCFPARDCIRSAAARSGIRKLSRRSRTSMPGWCAAFFFSGVYGACWPHLCFTGGKSKGETPKFLQPGVRQKLACTPPPSSGTISTNRSFDGFVRNRF